MNEFGYGMYYSDFTDKEYSASDFIKLVLKRVKRHIKKTELIDAKKSYALPDNNLLGTKLLRRILEEIFDGRIDLNGSSPLSSVCLDEWIGNRLTVFLENTDLTTLRTSDAAPLRVITAKEMICLGEIWGIQGTPPPSHLLIDNLQERYVQTKSAFVKSFENIEHLKEFRD